MFALSSDLPTIDPWWDLYMPATFGDADTVYDALESAEVAVPLVNRGDVYAVAARAFAVLGRFVELERVAEQAFRLGGPEAEALATFLRPDGMAIAERRAGKATRPGLRADAACDLAALHVGFHDFDAARAAVKRAQSLCPGHAEAARWARFLCDPEPGCAPGGGSAAARAGSSASGASGASSVATDAHEPGREGLSAPRAARARGAPSRSDTMPAERAPRLGSTAPRGPDPARGTPALDVRLRAAVRDARDPRRSRRLVAGLAREALDLLPVRRTGWVSTERYQRRLLGTPPEGAWAPSATALGRLQDVGIGTCFFALDVEYAELPASHPLVSMEIAADSLRAHLEEGRDAVVEAATFWEALAAVDVEAQEDGAQLLAGLGTADPRLSRTAMAAVVWLAERRTERARLWEGYLAWLEHLAGVGGANRARALATARPADALAWRMAIETLRAEGHRDEVDRLVRAARSEPALSAVACELLEQDEPAPFRMIVSGRMTPRWPRESRRQP